MRLLSSLLLPLSLLLPNLTGAASAQANNRPPRPPDHDPPTKPGISPALFTSLERLARLVDIAYCVGSPPGITQPFSCASRCRDFPALDLVRTFNTGILLSDSCGYVAVDAARREIVVAFRGTYSLANAVVDLSTVPQAYVPYPAPGDGSGEEGGCRNCTVHMGFMASWRNAREVVVPVLREVRAAHPGFGVRLVGHSLGGAVAGLAGLELRLAEGWEDVVVTTFGEPRVGNDRLVEYFDRAFGLGGDRGAELAYRRVTHVGDPVPLLPLTEWGYRSHAGEVYIGKPDLQPAPEDLRLCRGDNDPDCIAGAETDGGWVRRVVGVVRGQTTTEGDGVRESRRKWFPARLKLWQLFFAHRDYFWRLGLCVPGGDPWDWGREKYNLTSVEEFEMRDL
ncbi:alpha/beta-hydrolase [Trichocladium antarcticum]|uniref:Alpha/beta-hydrolase n=1 Tax=Trichocladium antarcticum TaxID=1450529 RepID=A0AAN6UP21_9PEZI|nr:alpha/beta-hydrolase [Trichocladium antarcticum]